MKQAITVNAVIEPGNGLLLQVAGALRDLSYPPESLVWTQMDGSDEARIWMIVRGDDRQIHELAILLGAVPGVTKAQVLDPSAVPQLPLPPISQS